MCEVFKTKTAPGQRVTQNENGFLDFKPQIFKAWLIVAHMAGYRRPTGIADHVVFFVQLHLIVLQQEQLLYKLV